MTRPDSVVRGERLSGLYQLCLAGGSAVALSDLCAAGKAAGQHVAAFCKDLGYDLGERKLKCGAFWINILPTGGMHAGHIHPHSVISGTVYVAIPPGASALKLEDPRLPMMMAAPSGRRRRARRAELSSMCSRGGEVLLWESWLRHEVPMNMAEDERISVSFNYGGPSRAPSCTRIAVRGDRKLPPCPVSFCPLYDPIHGAGATRTRGTLIDPSGPR